MNQSKNKEREHSLKKSLFLYKMKQLKSVYILMGALLLLVLFLLFRSSKDTESFWVQMSMDYMTSQSILKPIFLSEIYEIMQVFDLLFYVLAFVLAFYLFQEFTDRSKLTLFRSLPYTRKQIFGSWFVLGAVPLAAGYVVMAAATGIKFLLCHSVWYAKYLNTSFFLDYLKVDTLGNAWMMILQDFIVCMAVYALGVFARVVMNHFFSAGLVFVGILSAPYMIFWNIFQYLMYKGVDISGLEPVLDLVRFSSVSLLHSGEIGQEGSILLRNIAYKYRALDQGYALGAYEPGIILLWLAFAALFTILAYRMATGEYSGARLGKTVVFENIFIVCTGLYFALLVLWTNIAMEHPAKYSIIIMVLIFAVVEWLMLRRFKGKGRYDALNTWQGK